MRDETGGGVSGVCSQAVEALRGVTGAAVATMADAVGFVMHFVLVTMPFVRVAWMDRGSVAATAKKTHGAN